MYELKKMESYLEVNPLGPGPRLVKKEFTGPRSHRGWETPLWAFMVCSRVNFTFTFTYQAVFGKRTSSYELYWQPVHTKVWQSAFVCGSASQPSSVWQAKADRKWRTVLAAQRPYVKGTWKGNRLDWTWRLGHPSPTVGDKRTSDPCWNKCTSSHGMTDIDKWQMFFICIRRGNWALG